MRWGLCRIFRNSPLSLSPDFSTTVSMKTACPSRSPGPACAILYAWPVAPTPPGATLCSPIRRFSPLRSTSWRDASTISASASPPANSKATSTPPTNSTSSSGASDFMFIGHFAVGFAAKKFAPRTSLATLLAAPLFLDLLWPAFLLLGWEHLRIVPGITRYNPLDLYDFPWSHSLLMSVVWATAFSLIYYGASKYRPGAIAIWFGVVSHWILDWITHVPDMPLYPGGGPKFGLGLWNHVVGTMATEIAMLLIAVWTYARAMRARDRIGRYA